MTGEWLQNFGLCWELNLKVGRDLYSALPAMTRDLGLNGLRSVASFDKPEVLRTYSLDPQAVKHELSELLGRHWLKPWLRERAR